MSAGGGGEQVDLRGWTALYAKLPALTDDMKKELRRSLRDTANEAAQRTRDRVTSGQPGRTVRLSQSADTSKHVRRAYQNKKGGISKQRVHRSLRMKLARAVTVETRISGGSVSVFIKAKRSKLQSQGLWRGAAHDWDSPVGWTHPYLGNRKVMVRQMGRQWFHKPLMDDRSAMTAKLQRELAKFLEHHNL